MDSPTETGIEISDGSNSFEEIPAVSEHSGSSSPVTPRTDRIPVPLSFGCDSPDHDSDSSFSELDSEAEAFYSSLNYRLVSPGTMDGHEFFDKQMSYGELMKKFVQCEEELRTTSLKLQEIEKLKSKAEKRESAENLRIELETARREIETKDAVIETEKRRALELQRHVADLESQLSDSTLKFENVVNELEVSKGCLAVSDAEISKLEEMLCDYQQNFFTEKTKLEIDIAGLLEKQTFLEAQVKDFDNLKAERRSREIQIKQMEEQLNQLVYRETELVSESGNVKNAVKNAVGELTAMVKEVEKQVELQRNAIAEGEEEKREAIRQLCFSLDHYKSGYRELLRFLSNNKKQVMVV